jgi:hypothetical protein
MIRTIRSSILAPHPSADVGFIVFKASLKLSDPGLIEALLIRREVRPDKANIAEPEIRIC